jgi:hypothetical protein
MYRKSPKIANTKLFEYPKVDSNNIQSFNDHSFEKKKYYS